MLGFSGGTVVKNLSANAGDIDMCSDPWVGKMPWSRKQQTTPVFLPGKSHGQRSLVGYSPWNGKSQSRVGNFTHSLTQISEKFFFVEQIKKISDLLSLISHNL